MLIGGGGADGCDGSHCALYLLGGAGADGCDGSHCALYLLGGAGAWWLCWFSLCSLSSRWCWC